MPLNKTNNKLLYFDLKFSVKWLIMRDCDTYVNNFYIPYSRKLERQEINFPENRNPEINAIFSPEK